MRHLSPDTILTLLQSALPGYSVEKVGEAPFTFHIQGETFQVDSGHFLGVFQLVPHSPGSTFRVKKSTFYSDFLTRELRKKVAEAPQLWEYLLTPGE